MAGPLQVSNETDAGHVAWDAGGRFSWSIPTRGKRQRSSHRSSRGGDAGEWPPRYRTGAAREPEPSLAGTEKKTPDLPQVTQAVWQRLPPEPGEVESWRAEELDHRRGLTSERDEMGSPVGKQGESRG